MGVFEQMQLALALSAFTLSLLFNGLPQERANGDDSQTFSAKRKDFSMLSVIMVYADDTLVLEI
ncbi:uncharacterized protein PHALS_04248 [Plasmopara halstedii]|uniref:RxLR-like protein n=1 Tax=Plasmopara halstedii TaxID=4781 RepID=A0A0P1B0G9_PLAHL|nr:uncharacterized protein PHALS_04248 [Plasmopara halstedii]CEG47366.1 hypothetical protein PHALS_04248 [Plasmopara halstedii]|eukprot:XP_024583735.1 hypothetical protein PHALS_04248 [Plasmopara halstedii]